MNMKPGSGVYDAAVAADFFRSEGKSESVRAGATIFEENTKSSRLLLKSDKMYFLESGQVELTGQGQLVASIGPGEVFGELTPLGQFARTATATAKTECKVLSLDDKQFQRALGNRPEFALMLMAIMIGRLRENILRLALVEMTLEERSSRCSVFDRKMLAQLMAELPDFPPAHHPAGKVIMREGEAGIFMYVVVDGTVVVSMRDSVVERVVAGGVIGEMALVDQSPRVAAATAETDSRLLAISRNNFMVLIQSNPAFGMALLKALAERSRHMAEQLQ